ncbi:MAG: alpha/beta hydrolase [Bryobacteraceae bacterium]|jgi:alpha-L-fucosidase 2
MRKLVLLIASILIAGASFAADAARIVSKKDLIYGVVEGSGLLADLAWPEGKTKLPVVLIVHGGRWRAGSKNDANYTKQAVFAAAGFFAMNIDYRLINATPAPACYQDLFTAIRWLHAHAAEYQLDADRIYLIGNSSGGHEVALAATLGPGPYPRAGGWDNADTGIAGAIAFSGAYDLNGISWGNLWAPLAGDANAGFATLSGAAAEEARRIASPLRNVSSQTKPILFLHSEDDRIVPFQQAVDLDQALTAAHVYHKFIRYKDRGHMGFTDDNIKEALAFIAELEARK